MSNTEENLRIQTLENKTARIKKFKDETSFEDVHKKISAYLKMDNIPWALFMDDKMIEGTSHSRKVKVTKNIDSYVDLCVNENTPLVKYFNLVRASPKSKPAPLSVDLSDNKIYIGNNDLTVEVLSDGDTFSIVKPQSINLGENHFFVGLPSDSAPISIVFKQILSESTPIGIKYSIRGNEEQGWHNWKDIHLEGKALIQKKLKDENGGLLLELCPIFPSVDVNWYTLEGDKYKMLDKFKSPKELGLKEDAVIYMHSLAIPPEKMKVGVVLSQKKKDEILKMKRLETIIVHEEKPKSFLHKIQLSKDQNIGHLKKAIFDIAGYFPENQKILVGDVEKSDKTVLSSLPENADLSLTYNDKSNSQQFFDEVNVASIHFHFVSSKKMHKLQDKKEATPTKVVENAEPSQTDLPTAGHQSMEDSAPTSVKTSKTQKKKKGKKKKAQEKKKEEKEEKEEENKKETKKEEAKKEEDEEKEQEAEKSKDSEKMEEEKDLFDYPTQFPEDVDLQDPVDSQKSDANKEEEESTVTEEQEKKDKKEEKEKEKENKEDKKKEKKEKKRKREADADQPEKKKRKKNKKDKKEKKTKKKVKATDGVKEISKTLTKDNLIKISGVKHKEGTYKWVVELNDGKHADLPGEDLIKLHPTLFLSFVEGNIQPKN